LVFACLGLIVWALLASGFVSYYYFEQMRVQNLLNEKQQTLDDLMQNYDVSLRRQNMLSGDYGALLGEYQWFVGEDYSVLLAKYWTLLECLHGNYSSMLNTFPELNKTCNKNVKEYEALSMKSNVTRQEFGSLLAGFKDLFNALAMKDLENYVGKISTVNVSLCIDYGNLTVEWHNVSISHGATLFDLTKKVANVAYTYWPAMEPGHILLDSLNNHASGYWVWYYWDSVKKIWVFGPVGCDAWMLNSGGVYKWECIS